MEVPGCRMKSKRQVIETFYLIKDKKKDLFLQRKFSNEAEPKLDDWWWELAPIGDSYRPESIKVMLEQVSRFESKAAAEAAIKSDRKFPRRFPGKRKPVVVVKFELAITLA